MSERRTTTRTNWKKAATELAQRVVWALKFMDTKSRGGFVMTASDPRKMQRWPDWFMDALDGVGYSVDRKSYYASKNKPGRRRP